MKHELAELCDILKFSFIINLEWRKHDGKWNDAFGQYCDFSRARNFSKKVHALSFSCIATRNVSSQAMLRYLNMLPNDMPFLKQSGSVCGYCRIRSKSVWLKEEKGLGFVESLINTHL